MLFFQSGSKNNIPTSHPDDSERLILANHEVLGVNLDPRTSVLPPSLSRTSCVVAAALAFSSFESHKYFIMYKMVVWRVDGCHYKQNFHSICYGESKTFSSNEFKTIIWLLPPVYHSISIQIFQIARYFSGFPTSNELWGFFFTACSLFFPLLAAP